MSEIELRGSPESVIESIRFTRTRMAVDCPLYRYDITWAGRGEFGLHPKSTVWCDNWLCPLEGGIGGTRWRMQGDTRPEVKLTAWVPRPGNALAVAYLLLVYGPDALPRMEARVEIRSQWKDFSVGNREEPGEPRRLFSQRYFDESGPGIYPAHIVDIPPRAAE